MRFTARPAEELILVILITFEFADKIPPHPSLLPVGEGTFNSNMIYAI